MVGTLAKAITVILGSVEGIGRGDRRFSDPFVRRRLSIATYSVNPSQCNQSVSFIAQPTAC